MITVYLYGELSDKFGEEINLDVSSPAEAVAALEANYPGKFKKSLVGNSYNVVRGEDLDTGEGDTVETLTLQRPDKNIHIVPVVEGAKAGVFQTILGVALMVVGAVFSETGWGAGLFKIGTMMALGGAIAMLSPQPNITGLGGVSDSVDPKKSFIFTGAENVTEQGVPVPLCYGEFEVGSVVISQSLTAERA